MRAFVIAAVLSAAPAMAADAPAPDYGAPVVYDDGVRIGETFVKKDLLDPYSAKFTWPYLFVPFTEKVPLFRRTTGYATCFTQNAKNAMGGYVGVHTYRIIIRDGNVIDIGMVSDLKMVSDICKELADKFGMKPTLAGPRTEPQP
jgi:hypothetical protein